MAEERGVMNVSVRREPICLPPFPGATLDGDAPGIPNITDGGSVYTRHA